MKDNISWGVSIAVTAAIAIVGIGFITLFEHDPLAACVVAFIVGIGLGTQI